MHQIDSLKVLRAARLQAEQSGLPVTYQSVAMILAGWCAALIRLQSSGYIRRGLPPIDKAEARQAFEEADNHRDGL